MGNKVVISGFGLTTSVAMGEEELKKGICDNEWSAAYTAEDVARLADEEFTPAVCRRMDMFTKYAITAAKKAFNDAGLNHGEIEPQRAGGIFSTVWGPLITTHGYFYEVVEKGPSHASPFLFPYTVTNAALGAIARLLELKGVSSMLVGCCPLSYSYDLIAAGKADLIVVGGLDNATTFFSARNQLAPNKVLFEGAVAVVLESEDHALSRGANIIGEIIGHAEGNLQMTAVEEFESGVRFILSMLGEERLRRIRGNISAFDCTGENEKIKGIGEELVREIAGENIAIFQPYQGLTNLYGLQTTMNLIAALLLMEENAGKGNKEEPYLLTSYGFGGNYQALVVSEY